jgi:hypothetical protein
MQQQQQQHPRKRITREHRELAGLKLYTDPRSKDCVGLKKLAGFFSGDSTSIIPADVLTCRTKHSPSRKNFPLLIQDTFEAARKGLDGGMLFGGKQSRDNQRRGSSSASSSYKPQRMADAVAHYLAECSVSPGLQARGFERLKNVLHTFCYSGVVRYWYSSPANENKELMTEAKKQKLVTLLPCKDIGQVVQVLESKAFAHEFGSEPGDWQLGLAVCNHFRGWANMRCDMHWAGSWNPN